jgi:cyclic 2,3-diphosphoglycerate synthetase
VQSADLILITGCEEPLADRESIRVCISALRSLNSKAPTRTAVLRPEPLGDISGKKCLLATTAPDVVSKIIASHLEEHYGCNVTDVTSALSDRRKLKEEVAAAIRPDSKPEVLLTELKAASMQVAVPMALEAGVKVVFYNNIPKAVEPEHGDLAADVVALADTAADRYRASHPEEAGN